MKVQREVIPPAPVPPLVVEYVWRLSEPEARALREYLSGTTWMVVQAKVRNTFGDGVAGPCGILNALREQLTLAGVPAL